MAAKSVEQPRLILYQVSLYQSVVLNVSDYGPGLT